MSILLSELLSRHVIKPGCPLRSGERFQVLRDGPLPEGRYILYWMQMSRRTQLNPALICAIELANASGLPLAVYEGLRVDYPGANLRIHQFILEGAEARHDALRALGACPLFYLQARAGEHRDTLARLSEGAAILVTDEFPAYIIPGQNRKLLSTTRCPMVTVDGATIVPMRLFPRQEYAARTLRPRLHAILPKFLTAPVEPTLSIRASGQEIALPWATDLRADVSALLSQCQVDTDVPPSSIYRGGTAEAHRRLSLFLKTRLNRYDLDRNDPAIFGTSELSPYLHFGMISPLEVALGAIQTSADDAMKEKFLEELIVRRELSFNFCFHQPQHATLRGLPDWARKSLAEHDSDPRPGLWTREQVLTASTPDPIWNLAQQELLTTGKIHGYARMLWGKGLLYHLPSHEEAHALMLELHDRFALDGRDPNTYTGVLWCLGLHDRPWGPAKPVIGLIRPMSSEAMHRKTDVSAWRRRIRFLSAARDPMGGQQPPAPVG